MANYYSDIPELKYHLENPMMKRIVELKERDFRDKDEFDYAPVDYADAMDSYNKVLDIVGDITANVIAPNKARTATTAVWIMPVGRWRTWTPWSRPV